MILRTYQQKKEHSSILGSAIVNIPLRIHNAIFGLSPQSPGDPLRATACSDCPRRQNHVFVDDPSSNSYTSVGFRIAAIIAARTRTDDSAEGFRNFLLEKAFQFPGATAQREWIHDDCEAEAWGVSFNLANMADGNKDKLKRT